MCSPSTPSIRRPAHETYKGGVVTHNRGKEEGRSRVVLDEEELAPLVAAVVVPLARRIHLDAVLLAVLVRLTFCKIAVSARDGLAISIENAAALEPIQPLEGPLVRHVVRPDPAGVATGEALVGEHLAQQERVLGRVVDRS